MFVFTGQLEAIAIFIPENFEEFSLQELYNTIQEYPDLEEERLKTELFILYMRGFYKYQPLLSLSIRNNLHGSFKEAV